MWINFALCFVLYVKSNYANFETEESGSIRYASRATGRAGNSVDLKQQFHLDSPSLRLLPTLRHLAELQDNVGYVDEV